VTNPTIGKAFRKKRERVWKSSTLNSGWGGAWFGGNMFAAKIADVKILRLARDLGKKSGKRKETGNFNVEKWNIGLGFAVW
jgi:hypothetical protein